MGRQENRRQSRRDVPCIEIRQVKVGSVRDIEQRVIGNEGVGDGKNNGPLEILLDLLDIHPELDGSPPLTQIQSATRWTMDMRTIAMKALRRIVGSLGRVPVQYALHSGRIAEATQLAAQDASDVQIHRAGRWESLAFMIYVRAGGEGAEFVSEALTKR